MLQPVAGRAIAHLIMVLDIANKVMCRKPVHWASVLPAPIHRVLAVVHKNVRQRLHQLLEGSKVVVVPHPVLFHMQQRKQRMMEVIAPLRIDAEPTRLTRPHNLRVVQIALGN